MPSHTGPVRSASLSSPMNKDSLIRSIESLMEIYFKKTWPLMQKVADISPDIHIPHEDMQELADLREETLPFLLEIASFRADKAAWDDPGKLKEIESALRYCIDLWDTRGQRLLQKRRQRAKQCWCRAALLFLTTAFAVLLAGNCLVRWFFSAGSLSGFPFL